MPARKDHERLVRHLGTQFVLHGHTLRCGGGEAPTRTQNVRAALEQGVERTFGIDPRVTGRARELLARARARARGGDDGAQG